MLTTGPSSVPRMLATLVAILCAGLIFKTAWDQRHRTYGAFRGVLVRLRWTTPFEVVLALALTLTLGPWLAHLAPCLANGWLSFLGGDGTNVALVPLRWTPWVALPFLAFLVVHVPIFARMEEELFRVGSERPLRLVVQACIFGPIHCCMGVPPALGLALIVPGLLYGWKYRSVYLATEPGRRARREALLASTALHAAWNWTVMAILLLAIILRMMVAGTHP